MYSSHGILMNFHFCLCVLDSGTVAVVCDHLIREHFTKKTILWAKGSFSQRREMNDATLPSHYRAVVLTYLSLFHWQLASLAVWTAGIFMDGEAKVRRKLQSIQSSDRKTRCAVCELSEDWLTHGFLKWVLCPPQTAGTESEKKKIQKKRNSKHCFLFFKKVSEMVFNL